MEVIVLDQNYNQIGVFEEFKSLIWDPHYFDAGAFEIYCLYSAKARQLMKEGNRVQRIDGSDMIGIIDSVTSKTDDDGIEHWIVSGRGALYLLHRRIVYDYKSYTNKHPLAVSRDLVNNNAISPADANRKIANLTYPAVAISADPINGQYRGENLHDTVSAICISSEIGIKAVLVDTTLEIRHYQGVDRTIGQTRTPPIIFSTEYGTLKSASWSNSKSGYANVAYVAGESASAQRRVVSTGRSVSGEERYEMFVDARDLQNASDDGTATMSAATYDALLRGRGDEKLGEIESGQSYDVEVDTSAYQYGVDYCLGDIVSVISGNVVGIARITEAPEYVDEEGSARDLTLMILSFEYVEDRADGVVLWDEKRDTLWDENGIELEDGY